MVRANKTVGTFLIILVLFLGVGLSSGNLYALGICERALINCINDPVWMNMFGSIYCLNGYLFCKKYIDVY